MQIANMGDLPPASIDHFLHVIGEECARLRAARTTPIATAKPMRESSTNVGAVGRRASRSVK